jgi:hypothetical protein
MVGLSIGWAIGVGLIMAVVYACEEDEAPLREDTTRRLWKNKKPHSEESE